MTHKVPPAMTRRNTVYFNS